MTIDFRKHLGMQEENRMMKVLIRKADKKSLLYSRTMYSVQSRLLISCFNISS